MSSRRPPRRDPRAEDDHAPPLDDLGRRGARPPTQVPSSGPAAAAPRPATQPGAAESDPDLLRSRYAEAETKRRRAEALADGLAQRVAHLETELREIRSTSADLEARLQRERSRSDAAERDLQGQQQPLEDAERRLAEATRRLSVAEAALSDERALRAASAAKLAASEEKVAEASARLGASESKLEAVEARLGMSQTMLKELDQALVRERARVAEIEAGQRRVHAAAVTSAREVLARLERHEAKLSLLRRDALTRAIALLDEAGAVHGQDHALQAARLTPSMPVARAVIPVAAPALAPITVKPPPPAAAPAPISGTARAAGRTKRTEQGLVAPPRGSFVDAGERITLTPGDDAPEIVISIGEDES